MKTRIVKLSTVILLAALFLTACGGIPLVTVNQPGAATATPAPAATSAPSNTTSSGTSGGNLSGGLTAYESDLEAIYAKVNPSVVSIIVNTAQGEGLGSGFVWDEQGHIVTNNHVVADATKIQVKFNDGSIVPASLVGADADSDLAVIKVENAPVKLVPVQVADSSQVKVGQVAIAIGNPFGLENTMTAGIVSAIGRTISANTNQDSQTPNFTIPDVIQTDASLNPGNSGGPLVDEQGALIGVNSQIESSTQSNAGIGFAIPSNVVQKVIPALIKDGKYEHPYLGITGTSLTPDIAKAMNLDASQRGALVVEVAAGGPASKAGLVGSSKTTTINGQEATIGGDVITAADGNPIKEMDDLVSFLTNQASVGQTIKLTLLRDGKEMTVDVTLSARPATASTSQSQSSVQPGSIWLGVTVEPLTSDIATQMGLPQDQTGLLIEQVEAGSPADTAGLQGSFVPVLINGKRVLIGGDVITAVDGKTVTTSEEFRNIIQNSAAGQEITLTVIRDGKQMEVKATLAEMPQP
ncbi:trypsin-like serine protease, typically periplasmic, contain C-terminal PDZ domain [Longilinea arvoryzae]|uniref:Trypsin-like serine protease, typically periplasmic, contain C-terminal PDZ domain n=1 Tax=Longilinea arvoryzae TaxID=360412 RepID=A0A0S7BGC1_9CHLR|nr:trypsin-like peptidase domain-containing protein [Longilinea arvoryzae]GAP14621.1 trypsin-like serine protease, typically periplasmic, contain C-terminal PDZ domain [Longilinea arvoryzae]